MRFVASLCIQTHNKALHRVCSKIPTEELLALLDRHHKECMGQCVGKKRIRQMGIQFLIKDLNFCSHIDL